MNNYSSARFCLIMAAVTCVHFSNATAADRFKFMAKAASDTVFAAPLVEELTFTGRLAESTVTGVRRFSFRIAGLSPGWNINQFSQYYYVRFVSGARAGVYYTITDNGPDWVTIDTGSDALVPPIQTNDEFKIYKYWTLKSLFPADDAWRNPLTPSVSRVPAGRQTQILLYNGPAKQPRPVPSGTYYFTGARSKTVTTYNDPFINQVYSLIAAKDYLWAINFDTYNFSKVTFDGREIGTASTHVPGVNEGWRNFGGALDAQENLYVTTYDSGFLTKFTPDGTLVWSVRAGNFPKRVLATQTHLWVAVSGDNTVMKFDFDGTLIGTYAVGRNPYGLTDDREGNIWVSNNGEASLSKLKSDGSLIGTYPSGQNPQDIDFDGRNGIWVACASVRVDNVRRHNATTGQIDGTYTLPKLINAAGNRETFNAYPYTLRCLPNSVVLNGFGIAPSGENIGNAIELSLSGEVIWQQWIGYNHCRDIAVDQLGRWYVGDSGGAKIHRVSTVNSSDASWYNAANQAPANNEIIYPDRYLIIRQPVSAKTDIMIEISGTRVTEAITTPLVTSAKVDIDYPLGLVRDSDIPLSMLGLENVFKDSDNLSPSGQKDELILFDNNAPGYNKPRNVYIRYRGKWHSTKAGKPVADNVLLKAGTGFQIRKFRKKDGASEFWVNLP